MARNAGQLFGIRARFRVITPLFLGGASPQAELRVPSIKAMLRFWHRAVDPGFCRALKPGKPVRESALWGGTERYAGQSKVHLAITEQKLESMMWNSVNVGRFNEGQARQRKNGLAYLGYPLAFREHAERTAFTPGSSFTLRVTVQPKLEPAGAEAEAEAQALVAALWMLGHVGALGSRSRRGFGALALLDWEVFGACPEELRAALDALPLLSAQAGRGAWDAGMAEVRQSLRGWFGEYGGEGVAPPHPHFGKETRVALSEREFGSNQWEEALNTLGRRLQDFRVRSEPDYSITKDHLKPLARSGGHYMRAAPGQVTFGLPLVFRFGSLNTRPSELTLVPFEAGGQKERQPSLLFARLVLLSGSVHPLFLRLSGAVPGIGGEVVGERRAGRSELHANSHALDAFMDSLE